MELEVMSSAVAAGENDAPLPHLSPLTSSSLASPSSLLFYDSAACFTSENHRTSNYQEESFDNTGLDTANYITAHVPISVSDIPHGSNTVRLKKSDSFSSLNNGIEISQPIDPDSIRLVCRDKVPGWQSLDVAVIVVDRILSGLTNKLFKVYIDQSSKYLVQLRHKKVLFRVYGENISQLYNPDFELQVFKTLGRYKIAPKLIAQFQGGRIEAWVDGLPLAVQHLGNPSVTCAVASILGRFHKLHTEMVDFPFQSSRGPCVFRKILTWKNLAFEMLKNISDVNLLEYMKVIDIEKEAENLENLVLSNCKSMTPAMRLVFCHNDTQENNILKAGSSIRLIDFEYTDFNYAGFDIANLFIEATIDYTYDGDPYYKVDLQNYPCEEHKRLFAAVYLSELLNQPVLPSAPLIKPFLMEIELFALASHMFWGFWSFVRNPTVAVAGSFDYIEYGITRLSLYRKKKEELVEQGIIVSE